MPTGGNLFAVLFPTEAEQIQQVAEAVGAPVVGPVVKTSAAITPTNKVVPFPASSQAAASSVSPPQLVQDASPASLTAAFLAAQALGYVDLVLLSAAYEVLPQGTAQFQYTVDPDQVLVLLDPLTVQSARHTPDVTATVTVGGRTILDQYALTHDEGVLLAAESVITGSQTIQVLFANAGWRKLSTTVILNGVAMAATTYQSTIAPILVAAARSLQVMGAGGSA